MISIEDCIGMCGLEEDAVAAIAEHEHLPEIEAAAVANYLLHKTGGVKEIQKMLIEDVRSAAHQGDFPHARKLLGVLRHFMQEHGEAFAPII